MRHCKLQCVTQWIFCPNNFTCKYSLQKIIALVQGFWFLKHHNYWAFTQRLLEYSAIVQRQGDLAARQGIQGQSRREFQVPHKSLPLWEALSRLTRLTFVIAASGHPLLTVEWAVQAPCCSSPTGQRLTHSVMPCSLLQPNSRIAPAPLDACLSFCYSLTWHCSTTFSSSFVSPLFQVSFH